MEVDKEIMTRAIPDKEVEDFIEANPEIKSWLRKKGIKTKMLYARNLIRYLEVLNKNEIAKIPSDMYAIAKEDGMDGDRRIQVLEEFQESCETIPNMEGRIFNLTTTVKSFYSFKSKVYQFPKGRGDYDYKNKKTKKIPTLQDIVPYIDTIPYLRNKTIIAIETCFPVRLESLTFLKWKHFKEVLQGEELPHVFLTSESMKGKGLKLYAGIEEHSFLTKYASDYVRRWKTEYENLTLKKIDPNDEKSLEEPFLIALKGEGKGEQLSYGALNNCFDRLKTEQYPYSLHIWRTFVNSALEDSGMEEKYRAIILGHTAKSKVEDAYTNKGISRLREMFRKALPRLDPLYQSVIKVDKFKEALQSKGYKLDGVTDEDLKEAMEKAMMSLIGKATFQGKEE